MRPAARAALGLLLLSLPLACAVPEPDFYGPHVARYDPETFYATTSMSGASFSADGERLLVTSDASGVFNAYSIPVAGGAPTQLTHSTDDAIFAEGWFPADDRLLYSADVGGNELDHVYVREPDGSVIDLTPGEGLKAGFLRWTADGSAFFVLSNERDPQVFDLYRYSLAVPVEAALSAARDGPAAYPRVLALQNPGTYEISDVSRDARWAALTKVRNNLDSDVYLASLSEAGAELVHVTPHQGDIEHGVAGFSPDGGTLFYSSNEGSEFRRVWAFEIGTGQRKLAYADDWDVMGYTFSDDGRWLSVVVNVDARTVVRVFDARTGAEVALPEIEAGDVVGVRFQKGGSRMAFYVNGDRSPANLYLLDLERGEVLRLTDNLTPAIDRSELVEAQVVRYPSFDGLEIPALLYRPHAASYAAPAPALVWVHGGPGGQSRKGYSAMIQHLVNQGYAVLAVNNRGSSGYGKTFYHLDDRRHGDVDLEDCIFGRRYLEGLEWVDGERVGIIGGSYGGYMVCAALCFEPEAFEVGVDIFGVTNWVRTLESIPSWWADFREALYDEMGDPEEERARLEARSPLFHAERIARPMLVIQGKNDPRVLQAESDEIVAALRGNGIPVEYVLFEDEGHGFSKKENRIATSRSISAFLDQHLRGVRRP